MTRPPKRVTFFDGYPHTVGGVAKVGLLLAEVLGDLGWQLRVVVPSDGPAVDLYRAAGVDTLVVRAPPPLRRYGRQSLRGWGAVTAAVSLPAYWWRLSRALAGSDLVHANDARGLIVAGPAARLARTTLVWHVHSQIGSPALGWFARMLHATVTVVSRAVTPPGLSRGAVVHIVPNALGQPAGPFTRSTSTEEPTTILSIGRLHPEKGLDLLIAASERLHRTQVPHRLLIVGGAQEGYEHYPQLLRQQAQDRGIADDVEFAGGVEDLRPLLQRAEIYVQPSRREAFGLAALEAMQAGLPVIASAVGGLPELVVDGATGRLVPPGDVDALATAMAVLINDPELRRTWGTAARQRAEQHYGVERFCTAIRDLYASAGGRK